MYSLGMKTSLQSVFIASLYIVAALFHSSACAQGSHQDKGTVAPTLKQITAEQDWIARSPQNPRWLIDGSAIKFSARREGTMARDFTDDYLLPLSDLGAVPVMITPENPGPYFVNSGDWNSDASARILSNAGDLFLHDPKANTTTQLTQTSTRESSAFFLTDNIRYAFWRDGGWFMRSLDSGMESQAADIRYDDAPKDKDDPDYNYLQQQQRDLFEIITLEDQREDLREKDAKAWRDTNPNSVPGPFYLGKDRRSMGNWLSPSGKHILVATASSKRATDPTDTMPNYISEDGYVSTRIVRSKVGHSTETPIQLVLLDLDNEKSFALPLDELPMIKDDPLAWLKEANAEKASDDEVELEEAENESEPDEADIEEIEPETRPVSQMGVRWNDAGTTVAVMLMSHDNKDRWVVLVDTTAEEPAIASAHHLRDEAWIGWGFNSFGFIPNTDTLWYLSEESGYGHLYTRTADGVVKQHTQGKFEVRSVTFTRDGSQAYLRTNRSHPGIQEIERLDLGNNDLSPITKMAGTVASYRLSPDESKLVFTYSNINSPPELYLLDLNRRARPKQITHTVTDAFKATALQTPQIIGVPSTHTDLPIYTRLYLPDQKKFKGPRPLVIFSHGAGYLQHANYEWSYYSREHMYHTILANLGFIVVAPDFRASSGYGRDWRTATYRIMGYPELEDFKDTIEFTVAKHNADPERVGIYGGSYGGFMTLMAMFLEPETYKAGAALRSVTDWAHYNHGWTSNILNTPEIDPEAYQISSPINHADGLQGHLLMLHGMQDDNVVAQDIIRLSQRLIELEKENWELALAPIEPHGYHESSSWLDQMRRIHNLFMDELSDESNP